MVSTPFHSMFFDKLRMLLNFMKCYNFFNIKSFNLFLTIIVQIVLSLLWNLLWAEAIITTNNYILLEILNKEKSNKHRLCGSEEKFLLKIFLSFVQPKNIKCCIRPFLTDLECNFSKLKNVQNANRRNNEPKLVNFLRWNFLKCLMASLIKSLDPWMFVF